MELLPLLDGLELLLPKGDSGKLSCTTLAVGGEVGELGSSSDLEQEGIYYKLNAKCNLNIPFYWQKKIFNSISN